VPLKPLSPVKCVVEFWSTRTDKQSQIFDQHA